MVSITQKDFPYTVTDVRFGLKDGNWGFQLKCDLDLYKVANSYHEDMMLDVHCTNTSALPSDARLGLNFLPMKISGHNFTYIKSEERDRAVDLKCKVQRNIALCGEKTVTEQKIMQYLETISKGGDPIFMIEFYSGEKDICIFGFKASGVLQQMRKRTNSCMLKGKLPDFYPKSQALAVTRWWILPLLLTLGAWLILLNKQFLLDNWIPYTMIDIEWFAANTIAKLLPIVPNDLLEAFDMGQIVSRIEDAQLVNNDTEVLNQIDLLKNMTGRDVIELSQIPGIRPEIELLINEQSIVQRVWGIFTFVNIVWTFAILGMSCTLLPCLLQVFGPAIKKFVEMGAKVVEYVIRNVVIPLIDICHNWGVFELLGYLLVFQLIFEGSQLDIREYLGFMITLTAVAMKIPLWFYSTLLHTKRMRSSREGKELSLNLMIIWTISVNIPLAIAFQSSFFGYFVFVATFHLLGFRIMHFPGGILVGWENKDVLERSAVGAGLIIVIFTGLRMLNLHTFYLRPFSSAVCCLGANVFFLALLIMSNHWYRRNDYMATNQVMLFLLLAAGAIGSMYGLDGMRNTALVYAVLWGLEKYSEFYFEFSRSPYLYIFSLSAFTYFSALYLNTHPEIIVSLFSPDV